MDLERLVDMLPHRARVERCAVWREDTEGVDQAERIHVSLGRDPLDQAQEPVDVRTRGVNREERHVQALLVCEACRLDGQIRGFLHRPPVRVFHKVLRRRYLNGYAVDSAIDGPLHVIDHAATEHEYLRAKVAADYFLDGCLVVWRDRRCAGLYPVDACLGKLLCDIHLLVLLEDNTGLLLAVPQRDVVDPHARRWIELLRHFGQEVPRADEPAFRFPGLV